MESGGLTVEGAIRRLEDKVGAVRLPEGMKDKMEEIFSQLELNSKHPETFWQSYQSTSKYIDWITNLPWFNSTQDMLDVDYAREKLNEGHYGLDQVKERILEYVSVLALNKNRRPDEKMRAPILLFVGLVGTGKTTMANSIGRVLNRQVIRIPFGGLGDPLYLRGQSRVYPEAEPGAVVRGLAQAKSNNPVILVDEIDRVADNALNTIMGVLVELLDPEQNDRFTDHYIDYPFDLSQAFFVATCNNTARIATAVLDRVEVIQMPSYNDEEKIAIGRDYLLPKAIRENGLEPGEIVISEALWPQIVRPLGFDSGVRTLKRNVENMCRKVAKEVFEGKYKNIVIDDSNVKKYLPQW